MWRFFRPPYPWLTSPTERTVNVDFEWAFKNNFPIRFYYCCRFYFGVRTSCPRNRPTTDVKSVSFGPMQIVILYLTIRTDPRWPMKTLILTSKFLGCIFCSKQSKKGVKCGQSGCKCVKLCLWTVVLFYSTCLLWKLCLLSFFDWCCNSKSRLAKMDVVNAQIKSQSSICSESTADEAPSRTGKPR